ncbi:hypothetical protein [Clostridium sp. BJN0013]|uniref:hypothetical protein n=1 Tax=Clostridium sp. BJN0013 TaxID=3236840 RepID=UPI0034C66EA4
MKSKYSINSIIRFILGILVIILSISILIGNSNAKVIMISMLICLGIFQIFNGIHFYKQNKKSDGVLLILSSIFIFAVILKIAIF